MVMAAPILLCDTTGMSNDRWLECRMHGPKGDIPYTIGGSDVAAIFGVSPWTTPLELWMIKKGRMKPKPKDNADQLEMGHLLEPIAAYWYAKKSGNYVYDDKGLYQHADHPYALANFDRRYERASDGQPGILECKSCTYHKAEDWVDDAIPCTTNSSSVSTLLWQTSSTGRSHAFGGIILPMIWQCLKSSATLSKRI